MGVRISSCAFRSQSIYRPYTLGYSMTTKIESEILAHLIQDHMKREKKALEKLLLIDEELAIETDETKVKFLEEVREVRRQEAMKHREWLREIAPLLGVTIEKFGGREHDKRTGIKVIVPTRFLQW